MMQPFLLKKVGKVWYYRLAGEVTFHTTGQRQSKGAAAAWVLANVTGPARPSQAGRLTLRQYSEPFYKPETDPRVARRRDEGRTIGLGHLVNCKPRTELYVWKDPIATRRMREVSRADLLAFRGRLVRKLGEQRNTIDKTLSALKTIFREAVYLPDIPADPTVGIGTVKESREAPDVLTPDEIRKPFPPGGLGPWPDHRARVAFLLAAITGMRRGELFALRWRDIDLEDASSRVARAWKRREDSMGLPKSGKPRAVPLPKATVEGLLALRDAVIRHHPDDLVHCYDAGGRMGETWWRKRFHRALEAAQIQPAGRRLVPHSLRHSLATLLAGEDYDRGKLRAALGWADEGIRRHYTHLGAERLRGQAEIVQRILEP